jgi:peptidoglycan/xylan/chitin deacetylase (PgdA/CDA1 family)
MKKFLFLAFMVKIMVLTAAVSFASHQITNWRNNHSAAISITFDDGYWSQPSAALNVLSPRNMKGTLFLMTDSLNWAGTSWSIWRTVASEGHEVAGHTLTHPFLSELTEDELVVELRDSQEEINANIPSQSCLTFAYPYGNYDDQVIDVAKRYYISARTVWSPDDLNYYPGSGYHPIDFYEVGGFSFDSNSIERIVELLDRAEQRSAWFVPLIHDIDPEHYPQRYEKFIQMLDELQSRNIWVETYGGVVRYMREKMESSLSVVSESGTEIVLDLTHSIDPTIYNVPLTIRSTVPSSWSLVSIYQGDSELLRPTTTEGNETVVYFDAVPNKGSIRLSPDSLPTYPVISVDPALLSASCNLGLNAPSQTFDVWNSGGGTLFYQISSDSSWLHCDIESGSSSGGKDSIMVAYETTSLEQGTYSANIIISDPSASNSPFNLPVHLTVSGTDSILELNFEEGSGSVAFDASGNANDGILTGAAHFDDSAKGAYALSFDGVDDRVDVPHDDSLKPSNISVALWVKQLSTADNSGYQGVIRGAYGDGYSAGFRILINQNRPLFQINFGETAPKWIWSEAFPLDEWTHIAWTYDHQTIKIYQNGELFTEVPETNDIRWSTYNLDLTIGYAQWYYTGLIDDVVIFDNALTEDQILDLYRTLPETPLIAAHPTSLTRRTNTGVNAESQTLGVWNGGSGTLNYTVSSDVDWIVLNPETGASTGEMNIISVDYENSTLAAGVHSGIINISEDNAENSPFSVSIQLTINTPPTANDENLSIIQDTPTDILLTASDADGDLLSYSITDGPQNGALTGAAPALTYTPAAGFAGQDAFTFQVDDGNGGAATATVTISVTSENAAPVAADEAVTTAQDMPVDITLTGSDPDGDLLSYSVTDGPQNGALTGIAPALTYTPAAGFVGDDAFTFRVDDGNGGTATATVTITVTSGNAPPVADDAAVNTTEETPVEITLTGSDPDGDTLVYSVTSNPQNGTLSGTAPTVTYTPFTGFFGDDSFTFEVDDGNGGMATGTIRITINAADMSAVMELRFDEGSGETAHDSSGNGIDGAIAGPVYTQDGAVGAYALTFDGVDDRVACGYDPFLKPSTISVSFWMKHVVDTSSSYGGILQGAYGNGYNNGFRILDFQNKPLIQINFGDASPLWVLGSSLTQNEWSHIVFTYDHETIDLYQNGVLVTSVPETKDINWAATGSNLYIGFSQWYFQGGVDEVRVFDTALTPDQIAQLYDAAN